GSTVHQIGLPYHWGSKGYSTGDAANELIGFVADPNVSIQESKTLTGNIEPGRRSRGRRAATSGALTARVEGEAGAWRDRPRARHKQPDRHGVGTARTARDEET